MCGRQLRRWLNFKLRNVNHMLRMQFTDIALAKKAIMSGLCVFSYHLSPNQIVQEEVYSLTPAGTVRDMTTKLGTVLQRKLKSAQNVRQ